MATMPTIDFGDRPLAVPGSIIAPHLDSGSARLAVEGGAAMQRGIGAAARALFDIAQIKDRADIRDATYAMHQAENWFNARWNGTDEVGADGRKVHTPGVADRDYRSMELDGTDSVRECRRLKREFRDTDIYRGLNGGARAHFDRQFAIYEGRLDNAAAANHMRLAAQKIKDQTEEYALHTSENVSRDYGADDATFANSAEWGATQMAVLNLGSLVENADEMNANAALRIRDIVFRGGKRFDQLNPGEQAHVRRIYDASLKNFMLNRIKSLAGAAANNQRLGAHDPESALGKADAITDGLLKAKHITEAQANAIRAETQKARRSYEMALSRQQGDNAAKIGAKLDEIQWKMAYPLAETGGRFDPSKAAGVAMGDEGQFLAELRQAVNARQISFDQGSRLLARYQKLREDRNQLFSDMQRPEQFAARSDAAEWVRLKQMVADADRSNTPAERIEAAVEAAKPRLSARDYFGLWHDARQRRNAEDDRIANQVFSAFLGVGEGEVAIAVDPARRGTPRSDSAISTLLGSSSAEYVQSGHWANPDFTVEDIDEAHRLVKDYLVRHPGDRAGADRLLRELVEPASRAARAKAFRDRIMQLRRYERTKGNAGVFSVQRAYAEEDVGTPSQAGKTDHPDK